MTDPDTTLDQLVAWLDAYREEIKAQAASLTQLDAAIGDADHGSNMDRGTAAVVALVHGEDWPSIKALFTKVGMTLVSTVGGAAGPLYGTFFLRFGAAAGDSTTLSPTEFATALRAGVEGVLARGKAEPGDKTMLDALLPAVDAVDAALAEGRPLGEALQSADTAAAAGRDATVPMQARKGRASYLGERSIGHQDPGATSAALLVHTAATTLG